MLTLVFLLASLGQTHDGPPRDWIKAKDGNWRYGWLDKGSIRYWPDEQASAPTRGSQAKSLEPTLTDATQTNFGLDRSELGKHGSEFYSMPKDDPKAKAQAEEFLRSAGPYQEPTGAPDSRWDTNKLHVTVIGPGRERVLEDLARTPGLVALKDDILVQGYSPEAWAVTGVGMPNGGTPTIVVQNGHRITYRANDYSQGPDRLEAEIRGELRRLNPNYDPQRDPGPSTGRGVCPLGFNRSHLPAILVAIAAVVYFLRPKAQV